MAREHNFGCSPSAVKRGVGRLRTCGWSAASIARVPKIALSVGRFPHEADPDTSIGFPTGAVARGASLAAVETRVTNLDAQITDGKGHYIMRHNTGGRPRAESMTGLLIPAVAVQRFAA